MPLPQNERPSFAPIQHNWQNYSPVYFIFQFFYTRRKDKRFWTDIHDEIKSRRVVDNLI